MVLLRRRLSAAATTATAFPFSGLQGLAKPGIWTVFAGLSAAAAVAVAN